MRVVVGLFTVMSFSALSQLLATEPAPPPAAPQAARDASSAHPAASPTDVQPGTRTPAVDPNATASAAAAAAKPPAVVKSDKPELTHDEQQQVSRGYKLEMRNGERWFCGREPSLGSRLADTKVCGTASMLFQARTRQQDEIRGAQHYQNDPVH